ncbi:MAG: DUF2157 domain-containing protein [Bacteroidota bacterium]
MRMIKDLPELLQAGVITQDTADRIQAYYDNKPSGSINRLFVVFGVLGSILVGLGIILIVAHNWDELSRSTQTLLAFLPLLIGQIFCGYTLLKKPESVAWREGTAAFLFFTVGASISLVSQIYHIPGDLSSFIFAWMLLCLPLVYVMKSSMVSLLYLIGITYYAAETGYWTFPRIEFESYLYWALLLAVLPHYYLLYKQKPTSNFMTFHHWFIPLSVVMVLGTVADQTEELMFIAYFNLFGLLYLIGNSTFFTQQKSRNNGYRILGSLGTIALLLGLSFDAFWEDLRRGELQLDQAVATPEFALVLLTTLLAGWLFYMRHKHKPLDEIQPLSSVFILFILTFVLGLFLPYAAVLINLYVLAIGILIVREGARKDHLGILNYGLLIITALVICRFFDTDLSFVIRGILFVSVGVGFFAANYRMLKRRKANE